MDRVTCRESCKRHMAVSGKVRRGKRGFSGMANDTCTWKCTRIQNSAFVQLLVLLLLVLVCCLLFVVVVVVFCCRCRCCCCCCRCCCNASYFRILWASKDLHIGGVFVSEAENHGIYSVFLLLETKFTVFTLFFGPGLAKTLVFTQFSACCKKNLFHA